MQRLLIAILGVVALALSVTSYRAVEARRLQAEIASYCTQIPNLTAAVDYTLATWPQASVSADVTVRLNYFTALVRADKAWCDANAQADQPALVQQTISWHFGNASEALLEYQAAAQASPPQQQFYPVVEIVDGDTVKIDMSGVVETLRLIGIDTPEVVDPRTDIQCYGPEASARAKALLEGKRVRIQGDSTQDTRDRYGRLLAYVWLEDGTFYNLVMVQEGYAREYTYDRAYQYQADFRAAEAEAKATKWGLWGACAVEAAPTPDPGPDAGDVYYANCTEARAAGAAPIYRGQPGYRPGLDRDNDGVACE